MVDTEKPVRVSYGQFPVNQDRIIPWKHPHFGDDKAIDDKPVSWLK